MGLIKEFKEFAITGNFVDLAVGVVIGAAFGKVVSSLVDNILMPPIGILLGGVDFKDLKLVLKGAQGTLEAVTLNYGAFVQSLVDFFIIAFCIFMLIKAMNNFKKKEVAAEEAAPEIPAQEKLLMEIRDSLKK